MGKNYALHIKEMGGQAPTAPVLFMKPTTSYVFEGQPILLDPKVQGRNESESGWRPVRDRAFRQSASINTHTLGRTSRQIGSVHHEVELAVVVDKLARRVPEGKALEHVGGYALAIDLTARDLQAQAKKVGCGVCGCVGVWTWGWGWGACQHKGFWDPSDRRPTDPLHQPSG